MIKDYANRVMDYEYNAFMTKIIMDAYKSNEPGYEFECPMHVKGRQDSLDTGYGPFYG